MPTTLLSTLKALDMRTLYLCIAAMLFTGLLSFALTPFARMLGFKIGAVDVPDTTRHFHRRPTPRCGGVAIFCAFFAGVLIFYPLIPGQSLNRETIGLLIGTFAIMLLGLWDDTVQLKPYIKFAGQLLCACVPVLCGTRIESVWLFGRHLEFNTAVSVLLTIFWIVVLTNAVNLIDGLDGLACGVSAIASVTLFICSLICAETTGVAGVPILIAILASACIGFLPFNMNPAKIFMGDTGALSLGFVLSVLSVMGLFKMDAAFSFLMPFIIFALPLFDTAFSFVRRIFHHQSPFSADRKHLHHRLLDFGFKQKEVVVFLLTFSCILGVAAILFSLKEYVISLVIAGIAIFLLSLMFILFRHKKVSEFLKLQHEDAPDGSVEEQKKD